MIRSLIKAPPNPRPYSGQLTVEGVAETKRWDCRRYEACLDVAAEAGWQQFHCQACPAYVPGEITLKIRREGLAAFAATLATLQKPGKPR